MSFSDLTYSRNLKSRIVTLGLVALLWVGCSRQCVAQADEKTQQTPDKVRLIETLNTVFSMLVAGKFSEASQHFVLPPNFKPEMLKALIDTNEISQNGIDRLEAEADFGMVAELFGDETANHFAKRANVDVSKCYGFFHETKSATAEVIAIWNGTRFKIVRLDDLGKLERPGKKQMSNQPDSPNKPVTVDLAALKSAVDAAPENVASRAQYAKGLFQSKNLPLAWEQLIAAQKIEPKHAGVAQGLNFVFNAFEKRGLFSVGVPEETIESVLGKATKKIELSPKRQRWVYAFFGVDFTSGRVHEVIDLRNATKELFSPTEIVFVDLDGRGWKCGYRKKKKGNVAAFYYLPGESVADWTEEFVVERFLGAAKLGSMEKIEKMMTQQIVNVFPKAKHKVLQILEDSVIVAFELPAKNGVKDQHKLVRLLKGPADLHRFAYTIRGEQPSTDMQKKWLAIFKTAKLTPTKRE